MKDRDRKRFRNDLVQIRLTSDEKEVLIEKANRMGLKVGGYLRQLALEVPPPRQARRPPIERKEVARLIGEFGRVGGNLNQIAKRLNSGDSYDRENLSGAIQVILSLRDAALRALGRDP